jgi:lysophospholipase L1-like esterase
MWRGHLGEIVNPRLANRALRAVVTILFVLAPAGNCRAQDKWVGSWATSEQLPEPQNSLGAEDLKDATLRQVVHLSIGGAQVRVQLSNRFSTAPLRLASVHIARALSPASNAIDTTTDHALAFSGRPDVTIPAGAEFVSDPISFTAGPLSDLAITIFFDVAPAGQTGHPGSRATSYLAHGNQVAAAELAEPKKVDHWYFIGGVDVTAQPGAVAIATLGDSITDGHGATTNGNDRWPDVLAKRLQDDAAMRSIAVLNEGIGGNRLLLDGIGPNALARFDRDVLGPSGIRYILILEGINDLGMRMKDGEVSKADQEEQVRRMISAYEQIIARAHVHGIVVIGATLTAFVGSQFYHPGPDAEADRQKINEWIRAPGHFDAFVDFDKVTRDPEHPDRLLAAFDSGDHLHPSPSGYAAMAGAIPLSLFHSVGSPQP